MADPWAPTFTVQDVQQQQLNQLTMQEKSSMIEERRAIAQNFMARAAKEKQQADKLRNDQEIQMRIAVETKGKTLEEKGKALIEAGQLDAGGKLLGESARILNQLAQADAHRATAGEKQFETNIKLFETLGRVAGRITNDDEFQATLDKLESISGKPVPQALRQAKWSPETQQQLISLSMSAKDRVEADRKAAADKETTKLKEAQTRLNEARKREVEAKTESEKVRTDRLRKLAGEKPTRTPSEDVKTVMNLIRNEFPSVASDDPGAAAEASYVAAQAQTLLKKNPGMSRDEAIHQSYLAAKANGEISTTTKEPGPIDKLLQRKPKEKVGFKPGEGKEEPAPKAPAVGTIVQGYRFKGGDPSKQENWEKQ